MAQCYCHQKVPRTGQGMALHAGFHPVIMDVNGAPSNLPSSMRHAVENRETSPAKSARPEIKNLARGHMLLPITIDGGGGQRRVGGNLRKGNPESASRQGLAPSGGATAEVHGAGDV